MYLTECPNCDERSLFWNKSHEVYECLACKKTYDETTLIKALKESIRLKQCPACRRMTCFDDPRKEKIRCLYEKCGKEFTPEQALVEEASFQVHLAQKPHPELPPPNTWYPSDQYEK